MFTLFRKKDVFFLVIFQRILLQLLIFCLVLTAHYQNGFSVAAAEGVNNKPTLRVISPIDNSVFFERPYHNSFVIAGTVQDLDIGDKLTLKYQIDGNEEKKIDLFDATGVEQTFQTSPIFIAKPIGNGSHKVKIWVEDDKHGVSEVTVCNLLVDDTKSKKPIINWINTNSISKKRIEISYPENAMKKEYKINNNNWMTYSGPFEVTESSKGNNQGTKISARSFDQELNEFSVVSPMIRTPKGPEISLSATSVPKGGSLTISWTANDSIFKYGYRLWVGTFQRPGLYYNGTDVGMVHSYKINTANIPAGSTVDCKVWGVMDDFTSSTSSTLTFTVTNPTLSYINASPLSVILEAGKTQSLSVTATYSDDSTTNVTSSATYSSSNTSIATVNSSGVVTGVAAGSTTVNASYGGRNAIVPVKITAPSKTLQSITTSPSSVSLETGKTQSLSVTAKYSDNSTATVTSSSTYSSSNTAIATVSSSGIITGVGAGSATITVSYGGKTTTVAVSVTAPDTTPPTVPTNLTATAVSSSQINLSWTASTDNVKVTGYEVYRNGTKINTTSLTTYSDTGLAAATTYMYTVKAYDAAGNISAASSSASAKTFAAAVPTLTLGSAVIMEAPVNDGSITDKQVVTLTNGTFAADMSTGVTVNNLPAGLGISVVRNSDTQITISFTGKATKHEHANAVTNASVTVLKAKISGATADVTSGLFTIDFIDAQTQVTYDYVYDAQNRLQYVKAGGVIKFEFIYDQNGNVIEIKK